MRSEPSYHTRPDGALPLIDTHEPSGPIDPRQLPFENDDGRGQLGVGRRNTNTTDFGRYVIAPGLAAVQSPAESSATRSAQFSDLENGERSQRLDRFYSACGCEIGSPLMIASIVFWVALALIGPTRSETIQLAVSRSRRGHNVSQRGLRKDLRPKNIPATSQSRSGTLGE